MCVLRSREIFSSVFFFFFYSNSSTLSERLVTPLFRLIEKLLLLCDGIVWAVREFLCKFIPFDYLGWPFFIIKYLHYDFDHIVGRNHLYSVSTNEYYYFYVMEKKCGYSLRKMGVFVDRIQ